MVAIFVMFLGIICLDEVSVDIGGSMSGASRQRKRGGGGGGFGYQNKKHGQKAKIYKMK